MILDVELQSMNACDATERILANATHSKVMALARHGNRECLNRMFRAGVSAYLLKDSPPHEMIEAFDALRKGGRYTCASLSSLLVADMPQHRKGAETVFRIDLTEREREVLQLLAEGRSTKETAVDLHVSSSTVETHRRHIAKKTGLHSIAVLTKYAIREGLTTVE